MARIYSRKGRGGRPLWYIDFRDGQGKRVRKSVGTDKSVAERALREAVRQAELQRAGVLPYVTNRVPISELREQYEKLALPKLRPDTREYYRRKLDAVFDGLSHCRHVSDLTPVAVEAYLTERATEAAPRTVNMELGALRRMLRWAVAMGLIANDPIQHVQPRKVEIRRVKRAFTSGEIKRLLTASPEPCRDLWLGFLYTGCRRSELIKLRWQHVDLDRAMIYVTAETSKTKEDREIPIHPVLLGRLKELHESRQGQHVFVNSAGRKWDMHVWHRLKYCLRKAGIPEEGLTLHSFRYTFVSQLVRAGVNIKVVQRLAGHKTVAITLGIYAQTTKEDEREGIERLGDLVPENAKAAQIGQHADRSPATTGLAATA